MKLPITKPYFGEEERRRVLEPLETGWVVQGPLVEEFEAQVAKLSGARFALATTSCTTALHLALAALDIGPEDQVILPSLTFVATANVIEAQRARPVFVDVDLDTFNLDVQQVADRVTARTRAILPVHLFGLAADMAPLVEVARASGAAVVEDAACAIGTLHDHRHVGTFGDAGCFSFHPRKLITTGEGGMVLTDREDLAARMRSMRDHGAMMSDLKRDQLGAFALPEYEHAGFNYRMNDLQGALGVEQMKRLPFIIERRVSLAHRYDQELARFPWLRRPAHAAPGGNHTYQSYVTLLAEDAPVERDTLALRLIEAGVSVRQGTHAVHNLGYYRRKYGFQPGDFPHSTTAERRSLALPLFTAMTGAEQDYVIEAIDRCSR